MPDSGHDPAFNNLNANFSFGFIFRFTWPRRQNCDIIMLKHLLVGRVNVRIILTCPDVALFRLSGTTSSGTPPNHWKQRT
ncbi:hypothetical protein ECZU51_49330 [Escherichia coli]|nr:hypothetical protein ECZU51_06130 [Escherichia coli]GHM54177.1 hypothetical protein ECZU51_28470 [Escherichia coli]GHM55742.1 hypothetical protein ECZU51_44120 [Escherichia coli]GHM55776.1 hypothetical protein ECZU51_44460 [Escherichia coli]GHM56263.1 hypothetical protein ECZU51_49330 [Escherichia coli]